MGKFCAICGRGKQVGYNVSHSHRKTKRSFGVNLQKKVVVFQNRVSRRGTVKRRVLVCTSCLKNQMKA